MTQLYFNQGTLNMVMGILGGIVIILFIYIIISRKKQSIVREPNHENNISRTEIETKTIAEDNLNETVLSDGDEKQGLFIKYNYGFQARLHQAPELTKERYNELKNYLLSYKDVDTRNSWKYERFMYKNKPIVKLWIHGENIKVYFNHKAEDFTDTKYKLEDVSYAKMHETTPSLLVVNGPRLLEYTKELIDIYLENKTYKDLEYIPNDYKLPFLSREKLIELGLVKDNSK
ncbi:hypothetical protein BN85406490 [Alteracholeplasma palmae J233]|uniref:Uncharacterized protein n=1 Tax=Alteracholeplasma palmae (strain ATCC 49389 / J233) TaxID=1318466 RepID=U4KRJ7_ALTPJ|nr:hypothetical protein [Alteracholeplasma palmae]CCV64226.1 hypothetical protein BN85406490 [Alteracholeplasma palmae J233]